MNGHNTKIPQYIYCVRCGSRIRIFRDDEKEVVKKLEEHGYSEMGKGCCECGLVCVLCYQKPPASPTYSLFFDLYRREDVKKILQLMMRKEY